MAVLSGSVKRRCIICKGSHTKQVFCPVLSVATNLSERSLLTWGVGQRSVCMVMHMTRPHSPLLDTAALFALLCEPDRLRLLRLLRQEELCVCELVDALRMPQYKVSRHLGLLRKAGLVEARREGKWVHYRIARFPRHEPFRDELLRLLSTRLGYAPEAKADDAALAQRLRLRRSGACVVGIALAVEASRGRGATPAV